MSLSLYSIGYAASQKPIMLCGFCRDIRGVQMEKGVAVLWESIRESLLTEDTAGVAHSNCKEGDYGTRIASAFQMPFKDRNEYGRIQTGLLWEWMLLQPGD